jgi:hypothetical protein
LVIEVTIRGASQPNSSAEASTLDLKWIIVKAADTLKISSGSLIDLQHFAAGQKGARLPHEAYYATGRTGSLMSARVSWLGSRKLLNPRQPSLSSAAGRLSLRKCKPASEL